MDAVEERPAKRKRSRFARRLLSWALLLFAANALRIALATAELAPASVLSDGWMGVGATAAGGVLMAALALGGSLIRFRSIALPTAAVALVLLNLTTLLVFPPHWLLDRFQTADTIFYVATDRPVFALTIDDGLDPVTTPLLLETLRRHNAKATFFVLGESIERFPDLARRCLDEGHELSNHQMTDQPALQLAPEALEQQMRKADKLLSDLTRPRWFRPGGGWPTERARRTADQLGYRVALGSVFPYDTHLTSTRFAKAYVAGRCDRGDIVVLHDVGDRGRRTSDVLESVLPALAERGLTAVTLSDLAP